MSKNPCLSCPDKGCGNHQNCDKYMTFYNFNRELGEMRAKKNPADDLERARRRRILIRKGVKP